MNKGEKAGEIMAGRKKEISIVAEDQNWRSYVHNELKCAEIWNQDWGFLSSAGGSYEQTLTKEEQIRKLEEELNSMNSKSYTRTNDSYGVGNNLEAYPMKHLNIKKCPDLMPCPRKPPGKKSS
mmetsp:Transcript_3577/g.3513  ORF Transcript_3577/g.3513 Transcript_3577/m.3513 type:complete len:123 (-) Transcript_3577:59-427(-)|eukprot:CAMPEP_0170543684 /NCGR_PEP_ID=MMETSP0211-20121228/2717_1 /TAXON_ID=311385 /ORGANISM="Pseudokeronopsis sp., Strain OXSARD2" /LENGTH=122 /DNA_ID=CAMNT_0010847125 /DNA_START=14 /DNA_END=382 /DNA_ORIENTATION=+